MGKSRFLLFLTAKHTKCLQNTHTISVEKCLGNCPVGSLRMRVEVNIKMDLGNMI
jgi:hypothetical protein